MYYLENHYKRTDGKKISFRELLDLEKKEAEHFSKINDRYDSAVDYFVNVKFCTSIFVPLMSKLSENKEISELTEESFVKNFFTLSVGERSPFNQITLQIPSYFENFSTENGEKYYNEQLDRAVSKMYKKFMEVTDRLNDYYFNDKDWAFQFKYNNQKQHFPALYVMFKNNILSKYHKEETFSEVFRPLLEEKMNTLMEKEFLIFDILKNKEIFTIDKEYTVEQMIQTGRTPSIDTWSYSNIELTSTNEINVFFTKYLKNDFRIKKDNGDGGSVIKVIISEHNINTYGNSKRDMVFFNKKDAESFYRDRLIEIKNKIDKALSLSFEF